jgi:hypothetical protein
VLRCQHDLFQGCRFYTSVIQIVKRMCFGKQTNFRNCKSQPVTIILILWKNVDSALFFQVTNSVQRTLFICSSTCRKAEYVEQPDTEQFYVEIEVDG